MAWTYSAWDQQTTIAAKITMLEQHRAEVADKLGPTVQGSGLSRSTDGLLEYYKSLGSELEGLKRQPDAAVNGGVSLARFRRARR